MAPIIIPETIVKDWVALVTFLPYSTRPISAALAPPKPLNKETNSGIFVISTFMAINQPMMDPIRIAIPTRIYIRGGTSNS